MLAELHCRIAYLRDTVSSDAETVLRQWRPTIVDHGFPPAAANLAHYLALRSHDISEMQGVLASRGLTPLGRSEAHVQTTLDAAKATLARLAEFGAPRFIKIIQAEAEVQASQTIGRSARSSGVFRLLCSCATCKRLRKSAVK